MVSLDELVSFDGEHDYALVGPTDDRLHEIRTTRFPYNTVCHLGRDFGDGVWRGCSGVSIGPRKLLTAAHCLYSLKPKRAPLRIRVILM
jgi:V8-like Glu-specific endopeptidase